MDPVLFHGAVIYDHVKKSISNKMPRDTAITTKQTIHVENLEDSIPGFVQDIYHFSDLVFAVKNSMFNLPRCVTYGRYRYMIDQLIQRDDSPDLRILDLEYNVAEPRDIHIASLSSETLEPFNNLLVLCVVNTTDALLSSPRSIDGSCSFIDEAHTIPLECGSSFSITYRLYTVNSISSERTRESFIRLKASESDSIPARSMFMLTDLAFPYHIIPGFTNMNSLIDTAYTADKNRYQWRQAEC